MVDDKKGETTVGHPMDQRTGRATSQSTVQTEEALDAPDVPEDEASSDLNQRHLDLKLILGVLPGTTGLRRRAT